MLIHVGHLLLGKSYVRANGILESDQYPKFAFEYFVELGLLLNNELHYIVDLLVLLLEFRHARVRRNLAQCSNQLDDASNDSGCPFQTIQVCKLQQYTTKFGDDLKIKVVIVLCTG